MSAYTWMSNISFFKSYNIFQPEVKQEFIYNKSKLIWSIKKLPQIIAHNLKYNK